jgi:hypothetical protein
LSCCLWVGHIPCAHVALRLLPLCWAHHYAHPYEPRWVGTMPAPHLETPDAWLIALEPREMGLSSRSKINGSCVRTQFCWVLHQNPRFLDPRILNIIIYFINIIIFIIINIINKIINKFQRKYYY